MSELFKKRKEKFQNLGMLRQKDKNKKLFTQCPQCKRDYSRELIRNAQYVCPECGFHYAMPPEKRILSLVDENTFSVFRKQYVDVDPLEFEGYLEKKKELREHVRQEEAVLTGVGQIFGNKAVIGVMNSRFLMGSMGIIVGEMITSAIEYAQKQKLPLIIFAASGGARMQEGMLSLMQMAKTSAAMEQFQKKGGLYILCLTHPTTGGVSASFAGLGDITLAEPGALIGFAGPRVIEQTINQKLPEGFQRAEYLEEHGFVDQVVERKYLREVIGKILNLHNNPESALIRQVKSKTGAAKEAVTVMLKKEILNAEQKVALARHPKRPKFEEYIQYLFTDFFEQKGDRIAKEDASICGGIALFHGIPVTVIGHRKGKNLEENLKYNFGMPGPEGYRKAYRIMKQAEKHKRPVITFIDTPGAYPGMEAEMNGQSQAIANNLAMMSSLKVPIISVVTGEGNSGGALAIGVADRIYMLENSIYSILSPEGFAAILWNDASKSKEACAAMKLTSEELLDLGIIDGIIPEPEGGIHCDVPMVLEPMDQLLWQELKYLNAKSGQELTKARYLKYRNMDEKFLKK